MRGYEVRVTKQALAQMSAIAHYIAHDLMAPEAANRLLDRYFHETIGFAGAQLISRVGRGTRTPDIDTIPEESDQIEACQILFVLAKALVMHREDIATIGDFVDTIVRVTEDTRAALGK